MAEDAMTDVLPQRILVDATQKWTAHLPSEFGIGVILGPTASGKAKAIRQLIEEGIVQHDLTAANEAASGEHAAAWPGDKAIISVIASRHGDSSEAAMDRLASVGLNSLPTWLKPYQALSNGQRARASMASSLTSGCAVNHFGATVGLVEARCFAAGLAKLVARKGLSHVVLGTGRLDVPSWSGADWVFQPATGELFLRPEALGAPACKRPAVRVEFVEGLATAQATEDETDAAFARTLPKKSPATAATAAGCLASASSFSSLQGVGPQVVLTAQVAADAATEAAGAAFDVEASGSGQRFEVPRLPPLPAGWGLGLLVGQSGSGKSTLLAQLCVQGAGKAGRGAEANVTWSEGLSGCHGGFHGGGNEGSGGGGSSSSVFEPTALACLVEGLLLRGRHSEVEGQQQQQQQQQAQRARVALRALGGSALEAAATSRPLRYLSEGEQHLVQVATAALHATAATAPPQQPASSSSPPSPALLPIPVDEFTSFLDRDAAKRAAKGLGCFLRNNTSTGSDGGQQPEQPEQACQQRQTRRPVVVATVHGDLLAHLRPDWCFDAATGTLTTLTWPPDEDEATTTPLTTPLTTTTTTANASFSAQEAENEERAKMTTTTTSTAVFVPPAEELTLCSQRERLFERARVRVVVRRTHHVGESRENQLAHWAEFHKHHYRDGDLNSAAMSFVGRLHLEGGGGEVLSGGGGSRPPSPSHSPPSFSPPVVFGAVLPQPGRVKATDPRQLWRESRLVVLPEYQGLGIGPRASDLIGKLYVESGNRYSSKTAHPRFGAYRDRSPHWAALNGSGEIAFDVPTHCERDRKELRDKYKVATDKEAKACAAKDAKGRVSFKHEYVGACETKLKTLGHRQRLQPEGKGMHLYFKPNSAPPAAIAPTKTAAPAATSSFSSSSSSSSSSMSISAFSSLSNGDSRSSAVVLNTPSSFTEAATAEHKKREGESSPISSLPAARLFPKAQSSLSGFVTSSSTARSGTASSGGSGVAIISGSSSSSSNSGGSSSKAQANLAGFVTIATTTTSVALGIGSSSSSSSSGIAIVSSGGSGGGSSSSTGAKRKAPAQWTFPPRRPQPEKDPTSCAPASSSTTSSSINTTSGGGDKGPQAGGGSALSAPAHSLPHPPAAAAERLQPVVRIEVRQANPKKRLSMSHGRYEKYKAATTKAAYKALGGSGADYKYDLGRGFVTEYFSVK